jgi:MoxR-like ATPase
MNHSNTATATATPAGASTAPGESAPEHALADERIGELVQEAAGRLIANVGRVIVGGREAITLVAVALLADGHVLLEDVPGVGKTLMAKAMARSLGCSFSRVQFTPDLLPSDVTGLNVFNQKLSEFTFRPGPLMANIVLADEINRATPRTQSCLLEAMEERQISVDGETRPLERPFLVIATQNPVEQEGTFPLPEAQLDRFLLCIGHGYPSAEDEEAILLRFERANPLDDLPVALEGGELVRLQALCRRVHVAPAVRAYLVALVRATREHPGIALGASPRATQRLYRAAQAMAAVQGRHFVSPDDVKRLAAPVLAHRLSLRGDARLRGQSRTELLQEILDRLPVPLA